MLCFIILVRAFVENTHSVLRFESRTHTFSSETAARTLRHLSYLLRSSLSVLCETPLSLDSPRIARLQTRYFGLVFDAG